MPKIDVAKIPVDTLNRYPDPFWQPTEGRERKRLGNEVGLKIVENAFRLDAR